MPEENKVPPPIPAVQNTKINSAQKDVKRVMTRFFLAAPFILFYEVITPYVSDIDPKPAYWVVISIEVVLVLILGFWAKTKPLSAILLGVVVIIIPAILFWEMVSYNTTLAFSRLVAIGFLLSVFQTANKLESNTRKNRQT